MPLPSFNAASSVKPTTAGGMWPASRLAAPSWLQGSAIRAGLVAGLIAVLLILTTASITMRFSRQVLVVEVAESSMNLARTVQSTAQLAAHDLSTPELARRVSVLWESMYRSTPPRLLGVVGSDGEIIYSSFEDHEHLLKDFFKGKGEADAIIRTICQAHAAEVPPKYSWEGRPVAATEGWGTCVRVAGLDGWVVIYTPDAGIEAELKRRIRPWTIGFAATAAGLVPLSLGLFHLAYLFSERRASRASRVAIESEDRYRRLFNGSPMATLLVDAATATVVDANPAACRLYRRLHDDLRGVDFRRLAVDPAAMPDRLEDLVGRVVPMIQEVKPDVRREVQLHAASVSIGGTEYLLVSVQDVTEQRRLEREVVEVSEREKGQLGRELHDGAGNHLAAVVLLAKQLARRAGRDEPDLAKQLDEIAMLAREAIEQVRAVSRGLCPVRSESNALTLALRELASRFGKLPGIECVFSGPERLDVDPALAIQLLRIAQEAVTNAVRHAQASRVEVVLAESGGVIELTVADNGVGIGREDRLVQGLGLRTMHYRASLIGAQLRIESRPGLGTRIGVGLSLSGSSIR